MRNLHTKGIYEGLGRWTNEKSVSNRAGCVDLCDPWVSGGLVMKKLMSNTSVNQCVGLRAVIGIILGCRLDKCGGNRI